MAAKSAGIVMYRRSQDEILVLLVHPGGPFWRRRDIGVWSIPKGEYSPAEDPAVAAAREFEEELGVRPLGQLRPLGEVIQRGGKSVMAFALLGDLDANAIRSNRFTIEWPPASGQLQSFDEVDRAEWFPLQVAREKLLPSQCPLLDRLAILVAGSPAGSAT